MKDWIYQGALPASRRRRWFRQVRYLDTGLPTGGGGLPTGGGGSGGVSTSPPTGGGGGDGGSAPAPSSGGGVSYAPPAAPGGSSGISPAIQPEAGFGQEQNRQQVGQPAQQRDQAGFPSGQAGAPGSPPATGDWAAVRQAMSRFGVQLPESMTPEQGYMQLAQAYQGANQRNYYADVGQAVAPHLNEFTAWQQSQSAQQAGQQQADPGPWNPPQFDKKWLAVVEEDPNTGKLRSKAGYDPSYGTMAQTYADFMQEQQRSFWENPRDYMIKMIDDHIQSRVSGGVQGSFTQYQEQVSANQVIARNQQWLYQNDPQGRALVNSQTGRPMLSPNGVKYYHYVQQAATEYRMPMIEQQNQYAMDMLERDALRARNAQSAAVGGATPGQTQGSQTPYIPPGAGRQPNVNGLQTMVSAGRIGVQPTTQQPAAGLSLYEMMRQGMAADGVTDDDVRRDFNRT